MTFREYFAMREAGIKAIDYKPGALVPTSVFRNGGPEHLNPFKAQNPSAPSKPKPYMPIFRAAKGQKQAPSGIVNR